MSSIDTITLEVADLAAAERFYADAFDLRTADPASRLRLRASQEPTTGFRGFTLSLVVAQPADADALLDTAVAAGATTRVPAARSMWGYGGVVQAPDGAIWKVATSTKKNTGPATRRFDDLVLLLGVADVAASRRCYVEHGFTVAKSFGRMYVEFAGGAGAVKLALYRRRALAKVAGVSPDGTGSHRIALGGAVEPFTDPDGFGWEPTSIAATP